MTNSIESTSNSKIIRKRKVSLHSKDDDSKDNEDDNHYEDDSSDEKECINRKSIRISKKITHINNNSGKLNGAQFIAAASLGNLPSSYTTPSIISFENNNNMPNQSDLNRLFQNIDHLNKTLNQHSLLFKKLNNSIEKLSDKLDLTIRAINKDNLKKNSKESKRKLAKRCIKLEADEEDDSQDQDEEEEEISGDDFDKNKSIKTSDNENFKKAETIIQNNKVSFNTVTLKNINNEELDAVVSNSSSSQNKNSDNSIQVKMNKDDNLDSSKSNINNNDNSNTSSSHNNNNSNDYFSDSSVSDQDEDDDETESEGDDEDYNNNESKRKKRKTYAHKGSNIAILNKSKIDTEFITNLIPNKDPNDKRYDPNEINKLRLLSHSYQNFAVKLLIRLFDEEEIFGRNVYGRNYSGDRSIMKQPLDPERINFIKETVLRLTKTNNPELAWASCVIAMNRKMVDINNKYNKNNIKNN